MSAGYAARLSPYPNKGTVGLPETLDSKRQQKLKFARLAEWVRKAEHLVILTGAGISTSAGIPDFRGPNGIWTIEKKHHRSTVRKNNNNNNNNKRKREHLESEPGNTPLHTTTSTCTQNKKESAILNFEHAKPTLTHRAITKLAQTGKLKYCITQNVDGLHRRAGLSRDHHSALHGCAFTEKCYTCFTEYFRDKDVGGMSFQPTGNLCELCGGKLHDTLLDWEDALPEEDFLRSEVECDQSDLVLCLGTSLRIEPVGSLPLRAQRFVIVNLQETPKDSDAAMIIKAPVDDVMDALLQALGYSDWKDEPILPIQRVWTPPVTPVPVSPQSSC